VTTMPLRAPVIRPTGLPVVRPASLADVPGLQALIAPFVATGDLLPRSEYDLSRHIKEYHVAATPSGDIVGSVALKIYSPRLAELGALAVRADQQGHGIGKALCDALLADARALGLREVFALTRKPLFFLRLGFTLAEREHFPMKVWADCAKCPRQYACDEVAVTTAL
jgi:N-acetylglutamate synthase-like GNAT family acetyltransferase